MYNPFSLKGKTVLVTGASSGIGRATAIECALLGANVIISARNEIRLKDVLNSLDRSMDQTHKFIIADLATNDGIDALVGQVGLVDGVVSNVGMLPKSYPIKFITNADMTQVINVNLFSHVMLAKGLIKKKRLNKGASYVFTSSVGGVTTYVVGSSLYDMSKAAINSFAKSCAVDFSSRNIRCNAVCPGMIRTPMTQPGGVLNEVDYQKDIEEHYLLGRYGEPEEVARTIVFLLSDASSFITGTSIMIDGGASVIH
jgi:NAD(P)-dependent dehydrogenase (short-subunit alcohol dehydrogenase family)